MSLKGSKTEENLKAAFAGESQANRRYLYFAQKADVEGYNDVATVFRSTAEGETGHAHGHLEFLGDRVADGDLPLEQLGLADALAHVGPQLRGVAEPKFYLPDDAYVAPCEDTGKVAARLKELGMA